MGDIRTRKSSILRILRHLPSVLFLLILVFGSFLIHSSFSGNLKEVIPQKIYRSAQPTPEQLREWTERYRIKTIINLRGDVKKEIKDEQLTARQLGIKMISLKLSSRRLTAKYLLVELIEAIESAETPILIHCRSGYDRAGTASALAAMAIANIEYEKAKWQAHVPLGPWKRKKFTNRIYPLYYSHISDIFRLYERYCRENDLPTNNWPQLKQWILDTDSLPEAEPQ
ncbi:MAG: dual specificity protein phosphatase family protein [Planctomycetes bacterium]|nr:dual specificity protein phosphatase family protein [Planctomycetota bacterium]